ncbi:MAG: ABC transporter permease, partial [Bacteroidetes bacterium]|nr:ABC transporter permease [Bacteroidota bacterium]
MLRKIQYNFLIAIDAISQNFLRAVLTSLGIVFGVASVIAMLAIGRGTQEKILVQMNTLGANSIIINPIIEQEEGDVEEEEGNPDERQPNRFTPGLSMLDAKSLKNLPHVKSVSPEIELETVATRVGRKRSVKIVGITPAYFEDSDFHLTEGTLFNQDHMLLSSPVCIIGYGVKAKFFATEEPIGKQIKCGKHWLTIIGVLEPRNISKEVRDELGIRNYDLDIYLPIQTVLLRYKNRSLVTRTGITRAAWENDEQAEDAPPPNYHQIDKIVVKVTDTQYSRRLAEILNRMLARRHNKVVDFQIIVPETLLQKKQENIDLFNWVLRAIASISLLVGGIGIT